MSSSSCHITSDGKFSTRVTYPGGGTSCACNLPSCKVCNNSAGTARAFALEEKIVELTKRIEALEMHSDIVTDNLDSVAKIVYRRQVAGGAFD